MPELTAIIQGSAARAWLYLPIAVVLGALHALDRGTQIADGRLSSRVEDDAASSCTRRVSGNGSHDHCLGFGDCCPRVLGNVLSWIQAEPWLASLLLVF